MIVTIFYTVLLCSFQKLIREKNEYVLPMKDRVRIFFIVAIIAMIIKLVVVGAESTVSYLHGNANLTSVRPALSLMGALGTVSDISFSLLIFYYLKSS